MNARNNSAPNNRSMEPAKTNITETMRRKIRALNRADVALYEHFARKFDLAIDAFGRERMRRAVTRLRRIRKFYERYCVGDAFWDSVRRVMRFVNRKPDSRTCKFLTDKEIDITDFIRGEQVKRYPGSVFNRTM